MGDYCHALWGHFFCLGQCPPFSTLPFIEPLQGTIEQVAPCGIRRAGHRTCGDGDAFFPPMGPFSSSQVGVEEGTRTVSLAGDPREESEAGLAP
jgi:hypothetical protein